MSGKRDKISQPVGLRGDFPPVGYQCGELTLMGVFNAYCEIVALTGSRASAVEPVRGETTFFMGGGFMNDSLVGCDWLSSGQCEDMRSARVPKGCQVVFFDSVRRLTQRECVGVLLRLLRQGNWVWIAQNMVYQGQDKMEDQSLFEAIGCLNFATAGEVVEHKSERYRIMMIQPTYCWKGGVPFLRLRREEKPKNCGHLDKGVLRVGAEAFTVGTNLPYTTSLVAVPMGDLSILACANVLWHKDNVYYAVQEFGLMHSTGGRNVSDLDKAAFTETLVSVENCDLLVSFDYGYFGQNYYGLRRAFMELKARY